MSNKKKKKVNEEVRDPQSDVNRDLTASVEKYMDQYMIRVGWNNQDQRETFTSLISEFIVQGQGSNKQRLINSYLEKGMQVLNLEISKEKISTQGEDDVNLDTQDINETLNKVKVLKKRLNEASKNLIGRNYNLDESKEVARSYLVANRKVGSLRNLSSINEQQADEEKRNVYLTNFKTFLRLYITREYKWTTETANSVLDIMVNMIEKTANDSSVQETLNRRVEDLRKQIDSVMKLKTSPEEAKNLEVAQSEFRKFAIGLNGWNGKVFNSVFTNILLFLVNARNVNIQRILVQKLSEIESSLPQNNSSAKEEDNEEPEQEKPEEGNEENVEQKEKEDE